MCLQIWRWDLGREISRARVRAGGWGGAWGEGVWGLREGRILCDFL